MTISGSGFHAGQTVTVYECVGTYQPPPGSTLDSTQCDTAPVDTAQATSASDGSITAMARRTCGRRGRHRGVALRRQFRRID